MEAIEKLKEQIEGARTINKIEMLRCDIDLSKSLTEQQQSELHNLASRKLGKIYEAIENESDVEYLQEMAKKFAEGK